MKVIYVNHSSEIQGAGLALYNIIQGVSKLGVNPIVVLPNEGALADRFRHMGVKVYLVMHYNAIYPSRRGLYDYIIYPYRLIRTLLFNRLAVIRFKKIVEKEHPDIIHTNSGVIRFAAKVAEKNDISHVWHIREFQSKDFFGVPIGGESKIRELYHSANTHCIAITKAVFRYFDLSPTKDFVIYDGVFSKNIQLPKGSKKKKYFLYVGSLQKGKGIFDALDAFDAVADKIPEYELLIAGKDYINIIQKIEKCKHADQIKYLGFRSDVYNLMANATALLVPSYYEGFGFTTTEAMLNKTIVIGRDVAGTKEQFDNGLNLIGREIGIRIRTVVELSNAIVQVCNMSQFEYMTITNSARQVVLDSYTIEKNAQQIIKVYESILYK